MLGTAPHDMTKEGLVVQLTTKFVHNALHAGQVYCLAAHPRAHYSLRSRCVVASTTNLCRLMCASTSRRHSCVIAIGTPTTPASPARSQSLFVSISRTPARKRFEQFAYLH